MLAHNKIDHGHPFSHPSLKDALAKAQKCVVSALNAHSKDEVLHVVAAAAALSTPGGHAYIAQLKTKVSGMMIWGDGGRESAFVWAVPLTHL